MANLLNGFGGSAGFGENTLNRNDDSSTGLINITSIFPGGIQIGNQTFYSFYINNNGNISFDRSYSTFTPFNIVVTSAPIIAPFFADVDTRSGSTTPSSGGTSTGSNLVYWDLDEVNKQITVTWDDVGYYDYRLDKINAFQVVLINKGLGELEINFRYEAINWLVGTASGNIFARSGYYLAGNINFELPQSGTLSMLDLESASNVNVPGLYRFFPYTHPFNNDSLLSISPANVSLNEGNSGTATLTYVVSRSGVLTGNCSVNWSLSGTGTNPVDASDFFGGVLPSGSLNFLQGETSKTISIIVAGDNIVELNETFSVNLSNPSGNVTIATATANGTVTNDDTPPGPPSSSLPAIAAAAITTASPTTALSM